MNYSEEHFTIITDSNRIIFTGFLSDPNYSTISEFIKKAIKTDHTEYIFDFSSLDYLNSMGMVMLFDIFLSCPKHIKIQKNNEKSWQQAGISVLQKIKPAGIEIL